MKIRSNFVSNSSSSSFIILSKKGELTKKKLIEIFKVPEASILKNLTDDLAETLMECANKMSLKELLEDMCWENIDEAPKEWQEILKSKTGIIYTGSCCDEDSPVEAMLCMMDLDYADDKIIIKKEGGY